MKKVGGMFQPALMNIQNCYGCGVCAIACPIQIVSIRLSEDGFYRPVLVDAKRCTGCGNCETVCSFLSEGVAAADTDCAVQAFSVFAKDEKTRAACSSGGIAYEMAAKIVSHGGEAAVSRYNMEKHIAEHYIARTVSQLAASRGSKYIQSNTVDAFRQIIKSGSNKKLVVGTPCQVDSFRRLIKKNKCEDDYLLMDFFCHGVPSMNMWKKYIAAVEKYIGRISSVHFRDKKYGWHNSWAMSITGDADKSWYSLYRDRDLFYIYFLGNKILNTVCYTCKFRKFNSAADIRVGDLWGQKFKDDLQGVSGVLALSEKGARSLNSLSNACHINAETLETVTEGQMSGNLSFHRDRWVLMKLLQYPIPLIWIYRLVILPQKAVSKLKRIIKRWVQRSEFYQCSGS